MDRIHQKAQQEQMKEFAQQILDKLDERPAGSSIKKEELLKILDGMIQSEEQVSAKKEPWDFSREKPQAVFVCGDGILIRPITPEDEGFYCGVRMQYSLMYRAAYNTAKENKKSVLLDEIYTPQVFYCIICNSNNGQPVGYLGIKDTSAEIWEVAIELDGKYTHQGFGSRSLRLYLNEIQRRTGVGQFRAVVEVDNIPSQRCFEGLGAKLVGLCDSFVLKTEDEKKRFEERNLHLISANMITLAERIGEEPRKLLSHFLDYRIKCPL